MEMFLLYASTGIILFCLGVYGLIAYEHFLKKALAVNIMSTGVFIYLVATANRGDQKLPDPVPYALVLTGIVVAVCATALMLAISLRIHLMSSQNESKGEEDHVD
ncbi:MAG: cation:proton antiporter subunit C [Waddliaceae bacterium]